MSMRFCRIADDLADESPSPDVATERLKQFRQHLEATIDGAPTSNLFLALGKTIKEFTLPKAAFFDLLDAFEQDQTKTRYENFDQLLDYCSRSANPVGRIVLKLADCSNPETEKLSDEICTGLQLANHWQDIARDRRIDRIYMPVDQWGEFGVEESMFDQAVTPVPLRQLIRSECDRAEGFFRRGLPLADLVPRSIAADIKLFVYGGLETLAAIRSIDFDVLAVRPRVSKRIQLKLVSQAILGLL